MIKKIISFIMKFSKKVSDDSLTAFAAQTTFYVLLAFFPFIMLIILIVSRMELTKTSLIPYITNLVPDELREYTLYMINDIMNTDNNSFTIITIVMALWSAAKGIQALTYGLNKVYEVEKIRNYFVVRLLSAIYTLVLTLMCVVVMVMHIFGNQIVDKLIENFPKITNLTLLIFSLKNIIGFLLVFLLLLLIYYQLPGRKGRVKSEVLGAAIAAFAFIVLGKLFSFYISTMTNVSYMYGSLTSIILMIMWIYVSMCIVLLGAEINYYVALLKEKEIKKNKEKRIKKETDKITNKSTEKKAAKET